MHRLVLRDPLVALILLAAVCAVEPSHAQSSAPGPKLGLQTWTLRERTFEQVVDFAVANQIRYLQLTSQHLDPNASPQESRRKKALLDRHGLVAYTFGVA